MSDTDIITPEVVLAELEERGGTLCLHELMAETEASQAAKAQLGLQLQRSLDELESTGRIHWRVTDGRKTWHAGPNPRTVQ